jgi:regulatory protein
VELSRKLSGLGYPEDEIRSALKVFEELGYIDDATYAEAHVRRRSNRRGPRALAAELAARGVDRQLVDQAIGRLDRDSLVRAAARLVERAIGGNRPATYQELLDTAGARLVRRGFSHAIAWAACREVWAGTTGASGS